MCWFIIDPRTGRHLQQVDQPTPGREPTLYLHNLALDGFFDVLWAFQEFLARHPRPPFEDLVEFVVDGAIPQSMMSLVGPDLSQLRQAMQDYWSNWDEGEDGYRALVGRPMLRDEKYWLVQTWLRRMAVGREQFYAGKVVQSEEWLVDWRAWDGHQWDADSLGRLRVFSDGSADAWMPSVGVLGYDNVNAARRELGQAGYHRWDELQTRFPEKGWAVPPTPPVEKADDPSEPFRYE